MCIMGIETNKVSYSLTNKVKRHIQSEEPIRFINSVDVVTFILDFLL